MDSPSTSDSNGRRVPTEGTAPSEELRTPLQRTNDLAHTLRRHWQPAAAVLFLTFAIGIFMALSAKKEYEATADILLQPTDAVSSAVAPDSVSSPANAQRDINTYAKLITVKPVAEAVRSKLGLETSADALASKVAVNGEADSNLVAITATDAGATRAARIATAFAVSYRDFRRQTARQAINQALIAGREALATRRAQNAPRGEIAAIQRRLRELEVTSATQTGGVQIVRRAEVPSAASSRALQVVVVAGFAGLILALVTALALNRFDRRLRDPDEIEAALGVPLVGVLPPAAASHADARAAASADVIASLEMNSGRRRSPLMVVSCGRQLAAAEVAVDLAGHFAESRLRVLLIEADLRRFKQGEPEPAAGLTTLLVGRDTLPGTVGAMHIVPQATGNGRSRAESVVSYSVLPNGPPVRNPGALLGRDALGQVLAQASQSYDVVVVDAGALLPVSDSAPLARLSDAILLVAERRGITREGAEQVRRALGTHFEKVVGVVVQRPRRRRERVAVPRVKSFEVLPTGSFRPGAGEASRIGAQ